MIQVPRILDARVFSSDLVSIGVVAKIFLDNDQRRLIFLLVKPGPFKRIKILRISDIEIVEDDRIILFKGCSLKHKKEISYEKVPGSMTTFIGGKVTSSKGEDLGKVRSSSYRESDGILENIRISKNAFVTMTSGGYLVENDDIISLTDVEIEVDKEKLIKIGTGLSDQMSNFGVKLAGLRKDAESLISSRERCFLVGRTSSLDITDAGGHKIIAKGEIITEDHISRASKVNKVHRLTLAAGSVEIRSKIQKKKEKK